MQGDIELNKFSLFQSDLFAHKSLLFCPSVCVLQIFEVDWEGEMQLHEPLLRVQKFSLFTSPLCSIFLSVLSLHTHRSSLFFPSVCVFISSHTSPLSSTLLSVFLSVHTQVLSVLPLWVLICSHTSPLCSTHLSVLSIHTQVLSVLPFCLFSYLFTHNSSLFYPSVCVLICSHPNPCSTPLCS